MSDLINGLNALLEARPAYEEARTYYEGMSNEKFLSPALAKQLGSKTNAFHFNYSRLVVTSRLDRMEISTVVTEDGSGDDFLAEVWNRNALDLELQDALEASLVFGDAYIIAGAGDDGVDVFYNDPLSTRVFYDLENPRVKQYAIKVWSSGDRTRVNLYYPHETQKWISKGKLNATPKDNDFEPFIEEDGVWPIVNETGKVPVFHLRTGRMYGTPEHFQSYGPQNSINKLLNTQISSIDFSTAPQRYFLQDPAANNGVNPVADFGGGTVDEDDFDDKVSNLKAGPGGVWNLQGIKEVGQFDVVDPNSFVIPFKNFIEAMGTITKTPLHSFNVGALPSGESLRAAEAPLNKRVASLETLFGGVIADLHEFVLSIYNREARVLVKWAPIASYDSAEVWATVDAKVSAGVPLRIALMESGFTDEQVEAWYPEGTSARSAKEIAVLADAIQKLGAATTLGVLSIEEARALLPEDIKLEVLANPAAVAEAAEAAPVASEGDDIKSKAEAMGILIRAGVDPVDAAERVGLQGVEFTGAMPTSLRLPQAEAAKLEEA